MDESDEEVYIPHIQGVHIGITFFEPTAEPMIVLNMMSASMEDRDPLSFYAAFAPQDLQNLVPEIVDAVIRARTIMEMVTTWPERRDEILQNLSFRWTGQLDPGEDDRHGQQEETG